MLIQILGDFLNEKLLMYDYIIIGAGLYGSVFAQRAKAVGKKVLVIDKRDHIAGNVYTEKVAGIDVHKYGAHIFHTNAAYRGGGRSNGAFCRFFGHPGELPRLGAADLEA